MITATWDKLRENFRKALNRRKRATKSGASGNPTSTCRFFKELSFLTDAIGVRSTQSNIQPDLFTPPASPVVRNTQSNSQSDLFAPPSPVPAYSQESQVSPPVVRKSYPASTTSSSGSSESSLSVVQTMRPVLTSRERIKKRKPESDSLQSVLERAIQADINKAKEAGKEENDEDELFCKSLVPSFKGLSKKKNKQAKIKFMQILLEMESDSD